MGGIIPLRNCITTTMAMSSAIPAILLTFVFFIFILLAVPPDTPDGMHICRKAAGSNRDKIPE